MSHTPGPWTIRSIPGTLFEVSGAHKYPVLRIRGGMTPTSADSQLIAAAPELLEALRSILRNSDRMPEGDPYFNAALRVAELVIAKAEGRG